MNNLRKKREELGLTLCNLAEKMNVHYSTISDWELERTFPRPQKRIALAKLFNVSVVDIFPELNLPKATHEGILKIGDKEIGCAVIKDGRRVISQKAVFDAFGRPRRGYAPARSEGIDLPSFLDAKNLREFINQDVMDGIKEISYLSKIGHVKKGYNALSIPLVCDVYLSARKKGRLHYTQNATAEVSEILVRSLSKIGIIGLVDEATGYQAERDRDELNILLAVYLTEEKLKWAKMFPDEFYKQLYRLKGWAYPVGSTKRTPYVGKLTNQLVYERLPTGVLDELKKRNPIVKKRKRRQWKHFQFLSDDIGQPDLRDHLLQLIAVMRGFKEWHPFLEIFERAFPKPGDQNKFDF